MFIDYSMGWRRVLGGVFRNDFSDCIDFFVRVVVFYIGFIEINSTCYSGGLDFRKLFVLLMFL